MARSECTVCNEVFQSEKSFNKHRVGSFVEKTRRCLTEQEMILKGMSKSSKGLWVTETLDAEKAFSKKEGMEV